ncbi:flavin reductase family protein [Prevotella sp. KH2C16]|uniref:flavin reductase family protein n=1 Tax=Prevotella sp. KH2C16 TaxID=1855325 RepID=UPI0008EDB31B|nr:flavin reductase family protein [Prevotella sp. KH2C16]SFF97127.1 NADH-FMN oxidoreductase RutF, flavin reductase (DIM6/NTAB) family [Prevotella sp. KH2C16]
MTKKKIDIRDYAGEIIKAMRPGILLTTKVGDKVNSMTIGWGTLGIIWERPIFVAYVRHQRYTREMLDKCREFTINVPVGEYRRKILGICGSKSGRDMDKIEVAGLTPVDPEVINTPGIKELPLTLECRVLYSQEQESYKFNDEITRQFYTMETGDHFCYYGEIVSAYIIED